jgi:hypothetical protein
VKLIFDQAYSLLVQSEGSLTPVTFVEARRGDGENVELVLLDDGRSVTLSGLEQFRLVAKKTDDRWSTTPMALTGTWVRNATTGRIQARVNYNTNALNALLAIGGSSESQYVDLVAQFAWRTNSTASWWRSQDFTLRLHNNVWRGNETDPVTGTPEESTSITAFTPLSILLGTDRSTSSTTIADVTDLEFPVQSGITYDFEAFLVYTAPSTGVGARFSITGPASPTFLTYRTERTTSASARSITDGHAAYDLPATTPSASLVTGNIALIKGKIKPSADGTVKVRMASGTGGQTITVKAGSTVTFTKFAA